MFMRTQRLFLRPHWPEDWPEIYAGIADEGVVRNLARAPWPYAEEDARKFAALPQDPAAPRFLITLPGEGVIGCIGIDPQPKGVELGYWIARPHWGRGYATEASRGALEIARMLGHRHVTAGYFADNPASGAVLRKLGFRQIGVADRYSAGRGEAAPCVEMELELADDELVPMAA